MKCRLEICSVQYYNKICNIIINCYRNTIFILKHVVTENTVEKQFVGSNNNNNITRIFSCSFCSENGGMKKYKNATLIEPRFAIVVAVVRRFDLTTLQFIAVRVCLLLGKHNNNHNIIIIFIITTITNVIGIIIIPTTRATAFCVRGFF